MAQPPIAAGGAGTGHRRAVGAPPDATREEPPWHRGRGWSLALGHLDGYAVLTACGEVDLDSTAALRRAIADAAQARFLVLDLTHVTFMDCAALGALIAARHRACTAGGWVRLVAPQRNVRRLLDLTGTAQLFSIHPSVAEANSGSGHTPTVDEPVVSLDR